MALHNTNGSGAPATTPTKLGQHYTDTLNGDAYLSIGTSSSADWLLLQGNDAELAALAALTSAANKVPMFSGAGTATLLDFKDEDDMASDSATAVPSQQSVKAYVDATVVGGGFGDVVGPASATADAIALFDGATGKLIKDSTVGLSSKQNADQDLTDIAALSPSNDDFLQRKAGAWTNRTPTQAAADLSSLVKPVEFIAIACSDETTALTTGTAKATFRMPYAFTLTDVRASVSTAPTGGTLLTVDVNESGSTILSTKLTFDASEKTTTTAATPRVISDSSLADDAEITIDIDAVGSTIAGAGLKVYLIGTRT